MWSKLEGSRLWNWAKFVYAENDLEYHNFNHILSIYDFYEKNKIEYNELLDYAVLFHDIVYDNEPYKESRSALLYKNLLSEEREPRHNDDDIDRVMDIILATVDHKILEGNTLANLMILGDLHQLADPVLRINNFVSIMNENKKLYPSMSIHKLAENSIYHLSKLLINLIGNQNLKIYPLLHDISIGIIETLRSYHEFSEKDLLEKLDENHIENA